MFLAPYTMGNPHSDIINNHRKVIGRNPIRLYNDKVPNSITIKNNITPNPIRDVNLLSFRYPKTCYRLTTLTLKFLPLFFSKITAFTQIAGSFPLSYKLLPLLF